MKTFKIIKIKNNNKETIDDFVTEEISLTIEINDKELITLLCSQDNINELTIGYLFTSGIIQNIEDIEKINIFCLIQNKWVAHVNLVNNDILKDLTFKKIQAVGCGKGAIIFKDSDILNNEKIISSIKLKDSVILNLMKELQAQSQTFLKTGGVHSAALVKNDRIIVFREDIGRHNAIDKVIGNIIKSPAPMEFSKTFLLTSGRISSEILLKIIKCKIPVIISRSAPTDESIRICREKDITLIGFVRGNRMNIYSGKQRIIV